LEAGCAISVKVMALRERKDVMVDKKLFHRRAAAICNYWVRSLVIPEKTHFLAFQNSGKDEALASVDALFVLIGPDEDAPVYSKSVSFQVCFLCFLRGCEFRLISLVPNLSTHWLCLHARGSFFWQAIARRASLRPLSRA